MKPDALRIAERRALALPEGCEVRVATRDGRPVIAGYAAVFNSRSQEMRTSKGVRFVEVIRPGAFARALNNPDVRALKNHDPNLILGRVGAGTLRLSEDERGLRYEADPPDTSYARDLVESLRRRDITGSSFAFVTLEDAWSTTPEGIALRELRAVELYDVGPVTFPAYPAATSSVRSLGPDDPASRSYERHAGTQVPTPRQQDRLRRLRAAEHLF